MLHVLTPDEVNALIDRTPPLPPETVPAAEALGRVLAADVRAAEYVPDFDRSTVDGYAVRAADTFGCSDAVPAILLCRGAVQMGETPAFSVGPGEAAAIPTGGALPAGADCAVMIEHTEDYGDGTVGILHPAAPGANLIFRGDDVSPGEAVLRAGRRLTAPDLGALAALGIGAVSVRRRPVLGILSTGNELVPAAETPRGGQIRDVNSDLLAAMAASFGAIPRRYGIFRDDPGPLREAVRQAAAECDAVLLSGGSSVGEKDAAAQVLGELGTILFHGIAMKPGKPTLLASVDGTPVFGLPGHPAAACFVTALFVRRLLAAQAGENPETFSVPAVLTENIGSNHGRAEYLGVRLRRENGRLLAAPVRGKSGLITKLAGIDGYFCIPRDCEGLAAGAEIAVIPGF